MRAILILSGAALALAACGSRDTADNDPNAVVVNDMLLEQNAAEMGGQDANAATNVATENLIVNDLTNNDADTDLANGL